ncbi:MAG: 4-hydroxy-tetrahydrodipicolinate reductase [Myxococcota bacterium]
MSGVVRVGVVGVAGRMGGRVVRLLAEFDTLTLGSALERDRSRLGQDAGELSGVGTLGVSITDEPGHAVGACDVLIDFSAPPACAVLAPVCAAHGTAYICASTGMGDVEHLALDAAAKTVPVLEAANLSVGVNVLQQLVRAAAAQLGADFDVEIFEIHHHHKRDAPSGTAYALGDAVHDARPGLETVDARSGMDAVREPNSLGYSVARGGDVAGEHTVFFFGAGERIELTHRSTTPDIFARGALRAANWLVGQAPGRYGMNDVLGIK